MKAITALLGVAVTAVGPACPAAAALPVGARAPAIETSVALAGKDTPFDLRAALRRGPVVLYFFPAAFTSDCTLEAHEFAEATDDFRRAGVTIIGMTAGNVSRITEFSRQECRDKFAVGAASAEVIKAYDVANATRPTRTDRVSYVISKDGTIRYAHDDPSFAGHVSGALEAVRRLQERSAPSRGGRPPGRAALARPE